jgi:hypothetical protein
VSTDVAGDGTTFLDGEYRGALLEVALVALLMAPPRHVDPACPDLHEIVQQVTQRLGFAMCELARPARDRRIAVPPLHAGDDEVGPRMPGERGIGDRRAVDVAGPTIERIFEECTLRWREGLLTLLHRARRAVDAGVEVVVPLRHLVQLIADEQCSGRTSISVSGRRLKAS